MLTNEETITILEHTLEDLSIARGSDYSGVEALEKAISVFKECRMTKTLYVVTYECYDADRERIDCYNVLGIADSVEKAKEIIKDELKGLGESLKDYECHDEVEGLITYTNTYCNSFLTEERYYFIDTFIAKGEDGKWTGSFADILIPLMEH